MRCLRPGKADIRAAAFIAKGTVSSIRPVRLQDLPLVYRLIGRGAAFDSQFEATIGVEGLRASLLGIGGGVHAFVLRDEPSGLGVLAHPPGALCAGLAYLSPALQGSDLIPTWQALLDGLTLMAGREGIVALRAEVDEQDSLVFETLRRSDFGVYARQTLWRGRLEGTHPRLEGSVRRASPREISQATAAWNARLPGLLRQVNLLPDTATECYLLDERLTPCGLAAVYRGGRRALIDLYLPLEAGDQAEQVLGSLLALLQPDLTAVTVRLRHDMEWLGNLLTRAGFECHSAQAVMIRHTLAHVRKHSFKTAPVKTRAVPTVEIVHN